MLNAVSQLITKNKNNNHIMRVEKHESDDLIIKKSDDEIVIEKKELIKLQNNNNAIETMNASTENSYDNEFKKWQCQICNSKYTTEYYLHRHMRVHNVTIYSCNICDQTYNDFKSFDQHRSIHYSSESNKKKICFRQKKLEETKKMTYHCQFCPKSYKNEPNLKKHHEIIHLKIRYKCDICDKTFTDTSTISYHKKTVHYKFKKFQCHICKQKLSTMQALRHHLKIHSKDEKKSDVQNRPDAVKKKTYCCQICLKLFNHEPNLKRHHENIHLKIRYNCDTCDKTFTQIDSLQYHKQTVHLNIKKFNCNICKKFLSSEYKLKYHLKNSHRLYNKDFEKELNIEHIPEEEIKNIEHVPEGDIINVEQIKKEPEVPNKNINSDVVNKSFPIIVEEKGTNLTTVYIKEEIGNYLDENLQEEINNTQIEKQNSHGEALTEKSEDISNFCEICNKSFTNKHGLRRHHESIHLKIRHQCNNCNKFFKGLSSLLFHKKTVHLKIKKYECHLCQQKFTESRNLNRHLLRHKIHKCTICNQFFSTVEILNEHYKAHENIEQLNKNRYNAHAVEETNDIPNFEEIKIESEEMIQDFENEEYLLPD